MNAPLTQSPVSLAYLLTRSLQTKESPSPSDGELLRQFVTVRDEAAFAMIVHRHGGLVLRTCQRIIGHVADAEDAFQATFIVLLRKAASVRPPELLAPWLHSVAQRCALAQRRRLQRHRGREVVLDAGSEKAVDPVLPNDWQHYLDQEIQRLPAVYRHAVVLCELEGKGRQEAARILGVAEGTLSSRLASARKKLAKRLSRRGLLSLAALGSWSAMQDSASAEPPGSFVASTLDQAKKMIANPYAPVQPAVEHLTQGVIQSMFFTKIKTLGLVLAGSCGVTAGIWAIGATDPAPSDTIAIHALPVVLPNEASTLTMDASDDDKQDKKKKSEKAKDKNTTQETIKGSGTLKTESRDVKGFHSILLQNSGSLKIKQTGKESLSLTTDDNLLPLLQTEVTEGSLVLKNSKDHVQLKPTKDNEYVLEVKSLDSIKLQGAGTITIQEMQGEKFELLVQGAGTVTLQGKSAQLSLEVQGSGTVNASRLVCDEATVNIPGAGTIMVNASKKLNMTIQGAGTITYQGDPEVTKSIKGAGTIRKANDTTK